MNNIQQQPCIVRRFLIVTIVSVSMFPAFASSAVLVEPSVALTRESIEIAPEAFTIYSYDLGIGSELVVSVDLLRWRQQPLRIWLLNEPNYQRFRRGQSFDYIEDGTGAIERAGQIVFESPSSARYFFVLDNSRSKQSKQLSVYAFARTELADNTEKTIQRYYDDYLADVGALLDVAGIEIHVRRCGQANAYAIGSRIVICRELHDELTKNAMPGARLFVLLHEISHSLAMRWGHRSININQIMIDRMASILFRMIDADLAISTAEWYSDPVRRAATFNEARMPRSRARRIAKMLNSETRFDRSWSRRVVLPRLRTHALESLLNNEMLENRTRVSIQRELRDRATNGTTVSL